ncbi:MAG: rod shape-determining protein MreC [Bacteroidaceae bacterium]|nr:rod shape-determining protein MreC [Bacteroidaceae bacterium]
MRNLIEFIQRFNHWILFLFLEIISLTLLFSYNGYQGSVWFSSANSMAGTMLEWDSNFDNFFSQAAINDKLTQTNLDLQAENDRLREALAKTRQKVDTKDKITYQYIPAKVVSNTLNEVNNLITINKGSADGVRKDMGVVDGNGVVGIVYLVAKHYSVVISVLNSHSNISCVIRDRGYFGYLLWEGNEPDVAYVNDIPRHAHFKIGDYVTTSGYSSVFPRGISVGKIIASYNSADGLSYKLKVSLATDFSHLRDVRVINNSSFKERIKIEQAAKDSLTML